MSNYRTGNDYWIAIGKEYGTGNTGYGTGRTVSGTDDMAWTDLTVFPDKLEIGGERATIDTGYKTLTGIPMPVDKVLGNYNYTLTISGILSLRHEIFLQGLMTKSGSIYELRTIPDFIPSFVILRVWNDAPTGTPAETYKVDRFKGAQLTKLSFSGASGDMVKYEATFNITTFEREISQKIMGTKPLFSAIAEGLFNFGDMEFALYYGESNEAKSFSFNIGYEIPDDATQYMNSLTRLPAIPLRVYGEFNYVNNYNKNGNEKLLETLLYDNNLILEHGFSLINNSHNWSFGFYAQPISYSLADPDKALFENNITFRLAVSAVGEGYAPLLEISIT
jgi:hypothetical protein